MNTPRPLIIDCHGHFTTSPPAVSEFRERQLAGRTEPGEGQTVLEHLRDDDVRSSVAPHQLRLMDERGIDLLLFSPQASAMGHHDPDIRRAVEWSQLSNNLIRRVADLFPSRIMPVCQLPQVPGGPIEPLIEELHRCVEDLGFVACNVNPDPSGGFWTGPTINDPYWRPLFDAMVSLQVPAMIHVSTSCNEHFHGTGAHYINADTSVFMQLLTGDLFEVFPDLNFVIPHGGGAVPYHWGRYEGIASRMGLPSPRRLLDNVFFDTCVYHQPGIDLLTNVIGFDNVLFASEMIGAVRGINPESGAEWDDTKRYVDRLNLSPSDTHKIFEGNVRRVYPRLDAALEVGLDTR